MTIGGKVLLCAAAFVALVVMLREEFVPIPLAFYSGVFGLLCFVAHAIHCHASRDKTAEQKARAWRMFLSYWFFFVCLLSAIGLAVAEP